MIIDFLQAHDKLIIDVIVAFVLIFLFLRFGIRLLYLLFLFLRTRYFWTPMVGDYVITHGMMAARQRVERVREDGSLWCTTRLYPGYIGSHSSSNWEKNQVTFLARGEWKE